MNKLIKTEDFKTVQAFTFNPSCKAHAESA